MEPFITPAQLLGSLKMSTGKHVVQWQDEGIIIGIRPHGERGAIVTLLTARHGLASGIAAYAYSQKQRPLYQLGNQVQAVWKARLVEHLGSWQCELRYSLMGRILHDAAKLNALQSMATLLCTSLAEQVADPQLFTSTVTTMGAWTQASPWLATYIHWEVALLTALGYGLTLERCAVTGSTENLCYVSPKSGCAVSHAAGLPYHDKLLKLPEFLLDPTAVSSPEDLRTGLHLTRYFLERHVYAPRNRTLPDARLRMGDAALETAI
jgi:DNA repair protein RecO (recombination protein O)